MEAEVLSSSRIAGCDRRHIHDPGFGSSGEHKLCSDRVPGPYPWSHLWAGNNWDGRGKGHKDGEDGHFNRLKICCSKLNVVKAGRNEKEKEIHHLLWLASCQAAITLVWLNIRTYVKGPLPPLNQLKQSSN